MRQVEIEGNVLKIVNSPNYISCPFSETGIEAGFCNINCAFFGITSDDYLKAHKTEKRYVYCNSVGGENGIAIAEVKRVKKCGREEKMTHNDLIETGRKMLDII